jgi:hypothetical protein
LFESDSEDESVGLFEDVAEGDIKAEHLTLYFPSSFASERFRVQGVKELSLRGGQANDALHNLRIQLGKKSFLYRGQVRPAHSQKMKTRPWASIKGVDGSVQHYARVYTCAREAMIRLCADAGMLKRYQMLTRNQLGVTTAITHPNARGQRHAHLAWFWTMDVQRDAMAENWMEECKFRHPFCQQSPLITDRRSLIADRWSLVADRWSLVSDRWSLVGGHCLPTADQ